MSQQVDRRYISVVVVLRIKHYIDTIYDAVSRGLTGALTWLAFFFLFISNEYPC